MTYSWLKKPKSLVFIPLVLLLVVALACGEDDTPTPRPTNTPVPATAIPSATATSVPATAIPAPTATPVPAVVAPTALGPPTPTTPPVRDELEPIYGGIIPMNSNTDIGTWDPHASRQTLEVAAVSPLLTGLIHYDPLRPGVIICDLCEEFSVSPDGKSWTFKLRKGVMWSDGTETTAEDVKFSFDRIVEPEARRPLTGRIKAYYDRSEVVDPYTVIIHNKAPAAAFTRIIALDYFKVYPKHWVEAGNDPKVHANIMGNGAFLPVNYTEAISFEHEKNPNYFRKGQPYIDGIKVFILTDPGTEIAAYRTERVLMGPHNSQGIDSLNRLVKDEDFLKKFDIWWLPGINGIHLIVNVEKPPFDNPIVREAINLAIDRRPIVDNIGGGRFTIGKAMGPNNPFALPDEEILARPGFRELNGQKHPDDIARAKQLWAEAGFGPNNIFKGEMITITSKPHPDQAQIIKEQLKQVLEYIDLGFTSMEAGAWINALTQTEFDMSSSGLSSATNDPDERFAAIYLKGSRNWARHEVAGVRALFEAQSQELDPVKRKEINFEMQRLVLDSAPATMETAWETQAVLAHKRIMTKAGRYVSQARSSFQHYHEWLLPTTPDRPAYGTE